MITSQEMADPRNHIRVFISSTVYDFETELNRIFAMIDAFGYDVCMSKTGTIPLNSRLSNLVNCVNAVEDCQVFLGIIRPLKGSGVLEREGRSITAQEFDKAFSINMPRFILADYRLEFADKFLRLIQKDPTEIPDQVDREINGRTIRRPNMLIHSESIQLYRMATQQHVIDSRKRIGNWAQPFKDENDITRFVEAQFKDVERIKSLI